MLIIDTHKEFLTKFEDLEYGDVFCSRYDSKNFYLKTELFNEELKEGYRERFNAINIVTGIRYLFNDAEYIHKTKGYYSFEGFEDGSEIMEY